MGLRDRAGRELQNPKKLQTTSPKTCGAFGIWDLGWESAGKPDALRNVGLLFRQALSCHQASLRISNL